LFATSIGYFVRQRILCSNAIVRLHILQRIFTFYGRLIVPCATERKSVVTLTATPRRRQHASARLESATYAGYLFL